MREIDLLWNDLDGSGAGSSNQLLPDPEYAIAQELLVHTQTELEILTTDISSTLSPTSILMERRAKLLERQRKLYIAIAPHKRIPLELLAEIFIHCVSGEDGTIYLPLHKPPPSWTLAHVCSIWRQVALNEPHIWNRLAMIFTPNEYNNIATLAREIISRSKESLLSLSLTSALLDHPEDAQITDLIMPYASRIQNLSLHLQKPACLPFFQLPGGSFGSLESLFVEFTKEHLDMLTNGTLSVFDDTCRLHILEVYFNTRGHLNPSMKLQLPWFQLTDITFSGGVAPPFAMILRVLRQCTRLINFTTSFGNNDLSFILSTDSDSTPIILPNLRSLSLNMVSSLDLFNRFLTPLVAPSLEAFFIRSSPEYTHRWPQWSFLSFVKRSNCPLTTLSTPCFVRVGDVEPLFAALPSLINISLPITPIPPSTLDAMIRWELLPALETLEFRVDSSDAFLDLVETRRFRGNSGYKGIKKATIRAAEFTDAFRDRFKKLKPEYLEEGRDITIIR